MYIFELTYNQQSLVLYHRRKNLASKLSSSLINAIEEVSTFLFCVHLSPTKINAIDFQ